MGSCSYSLHPYSLRGCLPGDFLTSLPLTTLTFLPPHSPPPRCFLPLCSIPASPMTRRWGRKPSILIAAILYIVGSVLVASARKAPPSSMHAICCYFAHPPLCCTPLRHVDKSVVLLLMCFSLRAANLVVLVCGHVFLGFGVGFGNQAVTLYKR